ncbi:MAG: hypothetical protein K0Q59_1121 [Paenibacillus sp.]|jgi:cell division transport system ATP-binding protein|nr:hypothetical protein [Paenibacillus sp.]
MIRLQGVCKSYRERIVLDEVSLHLEPGQFAFLQGSSGSGKSTLLKLLYRDIDDFQGRIEIAGIPIEQVPKFELRRQMGVIFQSYELLERKTVFENVALAGEVIGLSRRSMADEIVRLLHRVGLRGRESSYPHQLSGGEQQRVAIVRALLNRPALLLADEPTGNLDSAAAAETIALMRELQAERGMTMLVVTHSERLIEQFPAPVWHIRDGRLYTHE